jgi:hypothetical protein
MRRASIAPCFGGRVVVAPAAAAAVAASVAAAWRGNYVFTQSSSVLENNAKHLGLKSCVWIEDTDEYWWGKVTALKPDQRPTELTVKRLIEYYSLDCLADPTRLAGYDPALHGTPGKHASWRTKMPFRDSLADEFEAAARLHGYTKSSLWITVNEVRKQKLALVPRARPTGVLIGSVAKVYNADQFVAPESIACVPVSGYKRRPYSGDFRDALARAVATHKYPTGLFFTVAQLELFSLTDDVLPDAQPVQIPLTNARGRLTLFNIDEVEDAARVATELQRFPVTRHTMLVSGKPIANERMLAAMDKAGFTSKYWCGDQDITARGMKLKENARGVQWAGDSDAQQVPTSVMVYSVHQLKNPDLGFARAGSRAVL